MITDRDTNKVYFSKRLTWHSTVWPGLKKALEDHIVEYELMDGTRDIWARDYMPIQIDKDRFVRYVYDPDYLLDEPGMRTVASEIQQFPFVGAPVVTKLIIDGGNVIKCDDRVIMTDKVFVENLRIGLSHNEVMKELERLFDRVVIIPWNSADGWDFTGHADGMVRYLGNDRVLINNMRNHQELDWQRKELLDIFEKEGLDVVELHYETKDRGVNDWAYINYLQVGDNVFMPTIKNDKLDEEAAGILSAILGADVIPVPALSLVRANGKYGGGALNCISWTIQT